MNSDSDSQSEDSLPVQCTRDSLRIQEARKRLKTMIQLQSSTKLSKGPSVHTIHKNRKESLSYRTYLSKGTFDRTATNQAKITTANGTGTSASGLEPVPMVMAVGQYSRTQLNLNNGMAVLPSRAVLPSIRGDNDKYTTTRTRRSTTKQTEVDFQPLPLENRGEKGEPTYQPRKHEQDQSYIFHPKTKLDSELKMENRYLRRNLRQSENKIAYLAAEVKKWRQKAIKLFEMNYNLARKTLSSSFESLETSPKGSFVHGSSSSEESSQEDSLLIHSHGAAYYQENSVGEHIEGKHIHDGYSTHCSLRDCASADKANGTLGASLKESSKLPGSNIQMTPLDCSKQISPIPSSSSSNSKGFVTHDVSNKKLQLPGYISCLTEETSEPKYDDCREVTPLDDTDIYNAQSAEETGDSDNTFSVNQMSLMHLKKEFTSDPVRSHGTITYAMPDHNVALRESVLCHELCDSEDVSYLEDRNPSEVTVKHNESEDGYQGNDELSHNNKNNNSAISLRIHIKL